MPVINISRWTQSLWHGERVSFWENESFLSKLWKSLFSVKNVEKLSMTKVTLGNLFSFFTCQNCDKVYKISKQPNATFSKLKKLNQFEPYVTTLHFCSTTWSFLAVFFLFAVCHLVDVAALEVTPGVVTDEVSIRISMSPRIVASKIYIWFAVRVL